MADTVDMSVDFCGKKFKNPVGTASGTFAFGSVFEGFYDVSKLGFITCKGCAALPWEGNPSPRLAEVSSGILNSVGLQNPGIKAFVATYAPYLQKLTDKGCAVICQAVGHSEEEYIEAVELYEEYAPFASALEINISCPNISCGGAAIGTSPKATENLISKLRPRTKLPLIVKLAPSRVPEIAAACDAAGADALSLINTIPAMAIDIKTRKSRLSRPTAGMSGPAIHPIALRMVWEAHQVTKLPLCGMGGITSAADAAEFILAGASVVAVGTANLFNPLAASQIVDELALWVKEQKVSSVRELIGAFEW